MTTQAKNLYQQAQEELSLADKAYSEIYAIQHSNFQVTSGFGTIGIYGRQLPASQSQQARIKELRKVRSRHLSGWKRLMSKLEWDDEIKDYKSKGG